MIPVTSLPPRFIATFSLATFLAAAATAAVKSGVVDLRTSALHAGTMVDLTGQWLYQPGYAVQAGGHPQTAVAPDAVRVPVPQLLNRIHWWLDDSEDFNAHETARLKALGFDTDRAEDGWYYLKLNLPALPAGKHAFIEFEGVAMICRTYCNGQLLGEHKGMFSRFAYELTPYLKAGENLLAVFVSMEKIPPSTLTMGEAVTVNLTASKVRSLSKGMFGPLSPNADNRAYDLHGIWQSVKLVVRGAAKLDDVWFVPSLAGAEVRVEASSLGDMQKVNLRAKWTETKTGKLFAKLPAEQIELRNELTAHTLKLRNVKPKLWNPADPNLYRLEVTLESASGEVLDAWSHQVGFRTFEVRGNQFFLNGQPCWLRGANHLPYGKNPFDPALARKLIQSLHDANIRLTRTHATPWNEAWLNAADEIGLGVSLEGIRPWALAGKIGATPPELFAHWRMENEDVVKRARNHPSVFLYTVGNEMLLRDTKNVEKWQQLSGVVQQTRQLDPTRPVICSSEYTREPELYNELIQPKGIDDGDADDLHRYNNWYGPSSFVVDAKLEKEVKNNGGVRPLIGQEMSSGYPDLDTGLPVRRYTRDLLTPQAWVGPHAYPGSDPAIFLEHHRAVTKRWAERLRFERGTNTAGFMLFAAECWFAHSYDARTLKPYPVLAAMRDAYAPVGMALETGRRRFFSGEQLDDAVLITNDDEQGRRFADLVIMLFAIDRETGKRFGGRQVGRAAELAWRQTIRVPFHYRFPAQSMRRRFALELRLVADRHEISRTTDFVELMPRPRPIELATMTYLRSIGPNLQQFLVAGTRLRAATSLAGVRLILLGAGDDLARLAPGGDIRAALEGGATAIVFSPGGKFTELFSSDVGEGKIAPGEYADFSPATGTPLSEGLAPMDLKWWGRKDDWRVFVADMSHRLKQAGHARELIRYIPPHGYIAADKIPEQYRTVMFEIPLGKGRLWVCDLDLEASVSVDPAAQMFALNLLRAAADPNSTSKLSKIPGHEALLKGPAAAKNAR